MSATELFSYQNRKCPFCNDYRSIEDYSLPQRSRQMHYFVHTVASCALSAYESRCSKSSLCSNTKLALDILQRPNDLDHLSGLRSLRHVLLGREPR
jgi:hypothetical protein